MFDIIMLVIDVRWILHCDLNNFFASVEMLKHPEYRNIPMAVSGDPNKRHGIILAKNEIAKKYGIYTPETVYSALKKCPKLILVKPHRDEYVKYSNLVNDVYLEYTDRVERFSIDEAFLDITESINIFFFFFEIAYKIKEEIKKKYGLTISVGVSFNKSMAKLGSELKKPDAITVLDYDSYKSKIYHLPVEMLIYVGKNTKNKLNKMGIKTIGDLALSNKYRIVKHLGKLGEQIYNYANGIDDDRVKFYYEKDERKSVSNGITFENDIDNVIELEKEFLKLASKVSYSLREINMKASIISISLKDSMFVMSSRQKKIEYTNSYDNIVKAVIELLNDNYTNGTQIRYICVNASGLKGENSDNVQLDFFTINNENNKENKKRTTAMKAMDKLKHKYGDKVDYCSALKYNKKRE